MKKLALNLDELQVQSFATVEHVRGPGTVHGAEYSPYPCTLDECIYSPRLSCEGMCESDNGTCNSCWDSCQHTCATGMCACNLEP